MNNRRNFIKGLGLAGLTGGSLFLNEKVEAEVVKDLQFPDNYCFMRSESEKLDFYKYMAEIQPHIAAYIELQKYAIVSCFKQRNNERFKGIVYLYDSLYKNSKLSIDDFVETFAHIGLICGKVCIGHNGQISFEEENSHLMFYQESVFSQYQGKSIGEIKEIFRNKYKFFTIKQYDFFNDETKDCRQEYFELKADYFLSMWNNQIRDKNDLAISLEVTMALMLELNDMEKEIQKSIDKSFGV